MCEEEKRHGIREQMCRKSFKRILKELYDEGQIAYVNIHDKRKPEKVVSTHIFLFHLCHIFFYLVDCFISHLIFSFNT